MFFEALDFIQLDVSGVSVGAMSCLTSSSEDPVTGLILLKVIIAVSLPFGASACIIAWRNYKLKNALFFKQHFAENSREENNRIERDMQQLDGQLDEESPLDTHVLEAMIALLNDTEHLLDFRAILNDKERALTLRLFATYDEDGNEDCDAAELRMFIDDLGTPLNINDEQLDQLIDAVLVHDCTRHDVTPETAAELVKFMAKQQKTKSNRRHRKSYTVTDGQVCQIEAADEDTKFASDGSAHLKSEDFLILVGVYREVLVADMTEEEADEFELYPKGSPAWLHDYSLRATGKMVSLMRRRGSSSSSLSV